MFIVTLTTREFGTQYISGSSTRGYDHISEVTSSPVRSQAVQFESRTKAQEAADAANAYGGNSVVHIEEV
jgi:hypothetical protein